MLIAYNINILGRSARSRLGNILIVDDLNSAEVKSLLSKRGAMCENHAEKVYQLVGGRIKLINQVVRELKAGLPWIGMFMFSLQD